MKSIDFICEEIDKKTSRLVVDRKIESLSLTVLRLRIDKDLSQNQVATLSNVDVKTINRIEMGDVEVPVDKYEKVIKAMIELSPGE
ncbi:helix-turn-helix domain-containing protein [Alkalihalobacillus sp. NPDC078783]